MKRLLLNSIVLFLCALAMAACKGGLGGNTVTIGNQIWATDNLNVSTFRNGDPIPIVTSFAEWKKAIVEKKPACCDVDFKQENGDRFGKIYNAYAVIDERKVAPEGWHIANRFEWRALDAIPFEELISKDDWGESNGVPCKGNNKSGFNAMPVSNLFVFLEDDAMYGQFPDQFRNRDGEGDKSAFTTWWSIDPDNDQSLFGTSLSCRYKRLSTGGRTMGTGLPIRCVKDVKQ